MTDRAPSEVETAMRWRVGRKVGRTIYLQLGEEPSDDDPLIGVMDTPGLAVQAVDAVRGRSRDDTVTLAEVIEWLCGPDSFVPTGGTAAATRRRIADALLARFGASRADRTNP